MEKGYVNGSNLLLSIGGKAIGHCSTHTLSFGTETKERAVKPAASEAKSSALFKEKGITSVNFTANGEGFRFDGEAECGYKELLAMLVAAEPVDVKAFEREGDAKPYLTGKAVITSLEETNPAQDDATYSVSLESTGVFTVDTTEASE